MRLVSAVVALLLLAAGAGWAAVTTDAASADAATEAHDAEAVTPLLSMRRLPESLLGPRRDAAVAAAIAGIPPQVPGQSCLVVVEGGRLLVAHQPDLALIPASTQKLLIGAALLSVMDPDDTFRTTAVGSAPVDGVVAGDLFIVGGGDPLLSTDAYIARQDDPAKPTTRFEDLADAIVAAGVTRIDGAIVGDGSRYDDVLDVPSWPQRYRDQVQAGPLAGLLVNDGLVTFTPTEVAQNAGDPAEDPPQHAASVLTDLLRERGVTVAGEARSGVAPDGATELAAIASPPARTVVAQMLRYSDNTTAELLAKELAARSGTQGSTPAGLTAMVADLAATGVATDGIALTDGSGLDLGNRATCRALAETLDLDPIGGVLEEGLAVAGVSGTLRERMLGTPAEGNLRAKTGSLRNVSALAGVVDGGDGRTYTFAYVSNVPEGEFVPDVALQLQSDLGSALASLPPVTPPAEILPEPAAAR